MMRDRHMPVGGMTSTQAIAAPVLRQIPARIAPRIA
jgi:hypothetical protein